MNPLTSNCKNCAQPIYAAGGQPDARLGWLHVATGSARCALKKARATPSVQSTRTCPDCHGEMQATVKIDLSDVVLKNGKIVGYRIVIDGDDAAGLTLREAIDNAIDSDTHIYCENRHHYDALSTPKSNQSGS